MFSTRWRHVETRRGRRKRFLERIIHVFERSPSLRSSPTFGVGRTQISIIILRRTAFCCRSLDIATRGANPMASNGNYCFTDVGTFSLYGDNADAVSGISRDRSAYRCEYLTRCFSINSRCTRRPTAH